MRENPEDLLLKSGTSWTGTFLTTSDENCITLDGCNDCAIITSAKKFGFKYGARIVPVRTIAGTELHPGWAGNDIRIRTHGGETLQVENLSKRSSQRLYETLLESLNARKQE